MEKPQDLNVFFRTSNHAYCPRGTTRKEQDTPTAARIMAGTACHNTKERSPENMTNLPLTGTAGSDELQEGGTCMWFVSCFSLCLELAQPEVIQEHRLAGIKAGSRGTAGEDAGREDSRLPSCCGERPKRNLAERSGILLKGHVTPDNEGARPGEDAEGH